MKRKKIFKKVVSGILATALVVTSLVTSSFVSNAVETTTTDTTVVGSGSYNAAKGYWVTDKSNPTIYRCYPILLRKSLDTMSSNSTVELSYEDQYYYFRDLALYVTSDKNATDSYQFTSPTTRSSSTIADMTLSCDGTYDLSDIGLSLNLPTHTFGITKSEYVSFSEELNKKIVTEGDDENIKAIFNNYIAEVSAREKNLSSKGRAVLKQLISLSQWGTANFDEYCKHFGFVFELCSTATNRSDGKQYVLSYGDMLKGAKIGNDPYYIYKVFDEANKSNSLLTWQAKYNEKNIEIKPEEALGEATYFFCNTKKKQDTVSQAINIVLYDDKLVDADTSLKDVKKTYNITTSALNPTVSLGADKYKKVLQNAFDNNLENTSIKLSSNKTLKTSDKTATLKTLSKKGTYNDDLILMGYDVLKINLKGEYCDLSDINTLDVNNILSGVKRNTTVQILEDGFGNQYNIQFTKNNKIVKSEVSSGIQSYELVDSIRNTTSKIGIGSIADLKDLQASALLSGKLTGKSEDGILQSPEGSIYATVAYLGNISKVTSKEAEVYINEKGESSLISGVSSEKYYTVASHDWTITGKDDCYTYAIAWKANEKDITKDKELDLANDIMKKVSGSLQEEAGISTLMNAFSSAYGVSPLGVKYMKDNKVVTVGSIPDSDNNLQGINVLILNIDENLIPPVNVQSEDYVESNELNYIYPSLLGYKSSASAIAGMGNFKNIKSYTVTDTNSGDLWSYKADKVHYYLPTVGLFDVVSKVTKSFTTVSYPSYAYNLSRGLWNDNVVTSNYRGITSYDETVRKDITENLGLSIGAVGSQSSVTCGENVDSTVDTTKADSYKFSGEFTYTNKTKKGSAEYNYTITHSLNKYEAISLDTALNSKAGTAILTISDLSSDIDNKYVTVEQSASTLTVYPEIAFKYYSANQSSGVLNSVSPMTVYVMGEKARTMQPSSIRGIDMDYLINNTGVASGAIVSDGAIVGTEAYDQSEGLQVIAQGSDITMKSDSNVAYKLISYSLDVVDAYGEVDVRNQFSSENANYKPAEEHEVYVQDFIDKVQVKTFMQIGDKEYEMKSSTAPKKLGDTQVKTFELYFANGVLEPSSKTAIINDIASEYGISQEQASQVFVNSGMEQQLQAMFESNTDEENASKNKWYDEESVTLCIRKYVTTVDLGSTLVSDKIDYNVIGIAGLKNTGETINQTVDAKFTLSVALPDVITLIDKKPIKGTEFKVSSSTTYDFAE